MLSLTVRTTLDETLRILRVDAPTAFFRVAAELDGLAIAIEVEDERFSVSSTGAQLVLEEQRVDAPVQLRTDRHTILALIDGHRSMLDAVLARELALCADASLLSRVARAGAAFSDGTIRSRRARALLEEFRKACAPPR